MSHELATQYNPSGVIVAYITWAKVLIQRLSAGKRDWDDPNISYSLLEVFPWAPCLHWQTYLQHAYDFTNHRSSPLEWIA